MSNNAVEKGGKEHIFPKKTKQKKNGGWEERAAKAANVKFQLRRWVF